MNNFNLPLTGVSGTTINWAEKTDTANNIVISSGTVAVTRPSSIAGGKTVILTATVNIAGGTSRTKDLSVVIKAYTATEEADIAIGADLTALDETD